MKRVALVTGGSSGIGRAAAAALRDRGFAVYELSRRGGDLEGVTHLSADLRKEDEVRAAVQELLGREGRLDVVVNNAGFGISGAVEFTDTAEAERLFDVDFFGAVRVNRAALSAMRAQGGGRIIHVGSVAGVLPIPFQTYYSAAKAATHAYVLALRNEVRPYGVSVCALMPGDIRTGFTAAREKSCEGDEEYGGRIARSVERMERDEQNGMDPARVGRRIAALAVRRNVKPLQTLGASYKLFCVLEKVLPVRLVNRILSALYGGGKAKNA